MAAGFVAWAAWQIGRKVVTDKLSVALWAQGFAVVLMSGSPWGIPLILLSGGILGIVLGDSQKSEPNDNVVGNSFPWGIFTLFVGITSTCWIAMQFSPDSLIVLFERFYRYGYLVFGGGQVVVPVMQGELVDQTGLLTAEEFLSGFGLVQALPGPMFSFAAFAGGLSENHGTITRQALGALLGGFAIFLPGTLLLFCVHPIWEKFRKFTMGAQGSCRIKCNGWGANWRGTGRDSPGHRPKYANLCFLFAHLVCIDESQNPRSNTRDFVGYYILGIEFSFIGIIFSARRRDQFHKIS